MTTVKDLHRQAMQQADLGHAARREGGAEAARQHFEEAYRLERSAAEQLLTRPDAEPSRSILFRSAATLAIEAGRFLEAEQMVCTALARTPPIDIAEELRDLFEQINFRRPKGAKTQRKTGYLDRLDRIALQDPMIAEGREHNV